jgi:hypothetical protein
LITEKAAIRDDADVPTHLWDQHCSLILPNSAPVLDILRTALIQKATTCMWSKFHAFLVATHGEDWRKALYAYKHAASGRFCTTRKRRRGDRDREDREGDKNKRDKEKSQFDHAELVKDVTPGVDAIARFSKSDWWAWKKGLALFFWRWP